MSRQHIVYQWREMVASQMPHLSKPQAYTLALWSLGMVWARSCSQTAVVTFLSSLLPAKWDTVRQRLREWCYEADAKRGRKRVAIDPCTCFASLLSWVLRWWQSQQMAIALDATNLQERFVVLSVSVLYRGCAIPVAWKVLPGNQKHPWRAEWLSLLATLRPAVPRSMLVIVLADRGLYAKWLFQDICKMGWHPLLRINSGGKFRPEGCRLFRRLTSLVPHEGSEWNGRGTAFISSPSRLEATLLASWEKGQAEPWLILTDLPPEASHACWYGMRAWIDNGYKAIKRGTWNWHHTRMTDPDRAARLWLGIAVATLYTLSLGGEADEQIPESTVLDLQGTLIQVGKGKGSRKCSRLVSVLRRGLVKVAQYLLSDVPLPPGHFVPEPWPAIPRLLTPSINGPP